ncbi:pentatricopeptide repeat-containing protein At5g66520 [Cajanus cajan]|uniref:pentatricopeptide repeat-containing protein At5g66520 n=1 Tax=Cajanus cajan TaxID=3821 RepID=UPI00098DD39C|nr:pentatricopeptide repeat-containing protein At5g66520 [Cajanus cajan]
MREMKQIHAHAITHGLAGFAFVASKLLAFCAHAELRYALTIFTHIPLPTVFDYNAIITAFSRRHHLHRAASLFPQMLNDVVRPNARTFALLPKASPSLPFLLQLHSHILRRGHVTHFHVISSLLSAYSSLGATRVARRVIDESPHANDVLFSAMVSGYVRNGLFREAIELFRDLKAFVKPNGSLLVSALSACAAIGAFGEGKWIHAYVDRQHGVEKYELHLGTALIDFYTKCECMQPAKEVFGKMKTKDVAAWSAMILGLAINARNREALGLFAEMEKVGPRPNAITFIAVLTACNHRDLCGGAMRMFRYMSEKYGIVASIEQYGCVVDVLARSGEIEEAFAFVKSMPVEADGAIWGCLLKGCLLHGHVELGHRVGEYLVEFEPGHSGRYVLLANVYASVGKWERVLEMRKLMKERGVPPVFSWSFIEIDQTVHKFVVDDRSSSYSGEVYRVLNHLGRKLEDYSKANDCFLIP